MMEGYRGLVPGLRRVQGLDFDVIAMPVLEQAGHRRRGHRPVHVRRTPRAPRPPPTSWSTCSTRPPAHAWPGPATSSRRTSRWPCPTTSSSPAACPSTPRCSTPASATSCSRRCCPPGPSSRPAVADSLDQLFNQPILDNLDELTQQIDEESRTVLDPESRSRRARRGLVLVRSTRRSDELGHGLWQSSQRASSSPRRRSRWTARVLGRLHRPVLEPHVPTLRGGDAGHHRRAAHDLRCGDDRRRTGWRHLRHGGCRPAAGDGSAMPRRPERSVLLPLVTDLRCRLRGQ